MRFITARELADALGTSVHAVNRLVREGRIPVVEVSTNKWRFEMEAVVAALRVPAREGQADA